MDVTDQLLTGPGVLPQENEVLGNDSNGAAPQANNSGVLNRAAVDGENQLATRAHNVVQQEGDLNYDNGPFVFPVGYDGVLLYLFHVPDAA